MSVKSFGRAFRSRRPRRDVYTTASRLHDGIASSISEPTSIVQTRCFSSSPALAVGSKQQIRDRAIVKSQPSPLRYHSNNTLTAYIRNTAPLPYFPPTNNTPLDTLLQTVHRDQFTIDHLPDQYRRLVTRTKRHHVLADQAAQQAFAQGTNPQNTTLTVLIDDQNVPLRPLEKRVYHGAKTLTKALSLLRSPAEFDVLPTLVAAMAYSEIHVTSAQWMKLIFTCGAAGRPGIALKIAHDGIVHRRNEFTYTRPSLREMIRAQFVRFLLPDVGGGEKAVRRARSVVNQARAWKAQFDDAHLRRRDDTRAPDWLRVDPVVRGSLLFLQAGKTVRWHDGKEDVTASDDADASAAKTGSTLSDIRALQACWEAARAEIVTTNEEIENATATTTNKDKRPAYAVAREAVRDWEPVLQALEWSATVLSRSGVKDAEIDRWLPLASGLLSNALQRWKPVASGKGGERVGMQLYEGAFEDLDGWYTKDLEGKAEAVLRDRIEVEPEKERHPGH
ncbi:hypothetical protein Dda_8543 [Drechslerella dactyloides]|uniref:Uncharacterized protein n=1 Tax=Drechslerella dactyloides TaxID=74499 RepID=A0AAD6IQU9_DREDA|nr:hypothetical protein Dda_8543 [Drechslerella dactyloides]